MTHEQRAAARERFSDYAGHSDECAYITTLRQSFASRPRGPVSPCDCWNSGILDALDAADGKLDAVRQERDEKELLLRAAERKVEELEGAIGVLDKSLRAQRGAMEADKARIDWMEAEVISGRIGNGLAIMPTTTVTTGERKWYLVDLEDEDVGEEITAGMPTLRAAIDVAMEATK